MAKPVGRSLILGDRRASKELQAYHRALELETRKEGAELAARGQLVELELALNASVVTTAASNEMLVAERMMARAGSSRVAQTIAADRINRLMQVDDSTLRRGGF